MVGAASGGAFLVSYRAAMLAHAGSAIGATAVAAGTIRPNPHPSPRRVAAGREGAA